MKKTKFNLPKNTKPEDLYKKIQNTFPGTKKDKRDGLYLEFSDKSTWLHIRPSNTEPVVRMILEAQSKPELQRLLKKATAAFS